MIIITIIISIIIIIIIMIIVIKIIIIITIIIIIIILIINAEISWWSGRKLCNAVAEVCLVSSVVLLSCFQPDCSA